MRLLFVNYECPPMGGGAGFATLALARQMACRGHTVDVLTARVGDMPAEEEIDAVRIHRVPTYRRGVHEVGLEGALSFLFSAAARLPGLARQHRYDLYLYYFGLPTGILSRLPGPHRGRPYVIALRGSDVPGYEPQLATFHRALWPVTRRVWAGAAHVVANSDGLRRIALRAAPRQAIDVIPNGVELDASPTREHTAVRELRLLTVSRLIERKGLDTLLHAAAMRPEVRVTIAGEGPLRAELEQLAERLQISERVQFRGLVRRAELGKLHREADAFVLSSNSESCSMALLEAMGAGLPIVATRVGGTPELIEQDVNGLLVPAGDAAVLAAALGALAADPGLRARYSAANRRIARNRFSWQEVARRYEALFEKSLATCAD